MNLNSLAHVYKKKYNSEILSELKTNSLSKRVELVHFYKQSRREYYGSEL